MKLTLELVPSSEALLSRLGAITARNAVEFESFAVADYAELDHRLVHKLDALLEPELGRWEASDSRWYQELDYYRDGVRLLEFKTGAFPGRLVPAMQRLLAGEHASFAVVCWLSMETNEVPAEGLIVCADKVIATSGAESELWRGAAQ
jgi:hypothetical protein